MKHIQRADHTDAIRGEREEDGEVVLRGVGDLSARVHEEDGRPCVTSHWQPDEEDLRLLNAGGVIELDLLTSQIPPCRVSAVPLEPDPAAIAEADEKRQKRLLKEAEDDAETEREQADPSGRAPSDDWSERGHTLGKS